MQTCIILYPRLVWKISPCQHADTMLQSSINVSSQQGVYRELQQDIQLQGTGLGLSLQTLTEADIQFW